MKQVSTRELQRDGIATVVVVGTLTLLKLGGHEGWTVAIGSLIMAAVITYIIVTNRSLRH
jgi:hypothetical protein